MVSLQVFLSFLPPASRAAKFTPYPFPFNANQPIFLLITPTFFMIRFIDVTSNVYIKKGKKKGITL